MKKRSLSDSLKASVDQERESTQSKSRSLEDRIAKAESIMPTTSNDLQAPRLAKVKAPKRERLIRDTFTLPESDYLLLSECKKRGLSLQLELRKSEIIRAGLKLLSKQDETNFMKAVTNVEKIKTGRPKEYQ